MVKVTLWLGISLASLCRHYSDHFEESLDFCELIYDLNIMSVREKVGKEK